MSAKSDKKLIIAIGDYGTGKTAFAQWYAKKNQGLFIDFELLYFQGQEDKSTRFDTFIKRLAITIQQSSQRIFTLDGYRGLSGGMGGLAEPTFAYLRDNINCDIQICLCFTAPHILRQRQQVKANHVSEPLPRDESEIKRITHFLYDLAVTTDRDPLFVDTTDGFHFVSKEAWPQCWQELVFFSDLASRPHDKYYQDIELPSGLVIPGYSNSQETWKRLSQLIDFRGKDILDVGCFHGFFCFKAEMAGARSITGIELNQDAVEVVYQIAWLRKSSGRFYLGDVVNLKTDHIYDVALALNMLHHVTDIDRALENLFSCSKMVVFEIPSNQEGLVKQHAERSSFDFMGRANSHRADREIIIFAHPQAGVIPPEMPRAYQYNYRAEQRKKIIRSATGLALRMKIFYPLVWLVRKYRSFKKRSTRPPVQYPHSLNIPR